MSEKEEADIRAELACMGAEIEQASIQRLAQIAKRAGALRRELQRIKIREAEAFRPPFIPAENIEAVLASPQPRRAFRGMLSKVRRGLKHQLIAAKCRAFVR